MHAAVFAKTYPAPGIDAPFASAARDGYAGVQYNLVCAGLKSLPEVLPAGLPESVAAAASSRGISIDALSGTYNMAHPDADVRRSSRTGFTNVVAAAKAMGAPTVTLCTGSRNAADMWAHHPDNATPAAWADLRDELDFALDLAQAAGIKLAIEPEPGNVISDAQVASRLLREVGSSSLGIILDAANLLPPEKLPEQDRVVREALDLLGESLLIAHGKDVDASGKVVPAGRGAVDLAAFVAGLRTVGFAGALVGHGFEEADAAEVAKLLNALAGGQHG